MIDQIIVKEFDFAISKLREFFKKKNFIEAHVQHRLSILAACEDPTTVATFQYSGNVWPLPQTGQMHLECELLKNPELEKIFTVTTSYRQEPNIIEGRHSLLFPMLEFEGVGDIGDLYKLETELLTYLGFENFKCHDYNDLCEMFQVKELTAVEEERIAAEISNVCFICNFPESTSPFWNMKRKETTSNKIDAILYGMETIGSAERETDTSLMEKRFYTISDGMYAKTLFSHFGKDRVRKELDEFLSLPMMKRFGGGVGITRLIRALKKNGNLI